LDHTGKVDVNYGATLNRLDQAWFNGDVIGGMGEKARPHFDFQLRRGWSLGREESQHDTFFGVLNVAGGPGEESRGIPVAVKEFPYTIPAASKAIQEYGLLEDLRGRNLPAMEPVGLIAHRWKGAEPSLYLLIKMEPDLESLNSQDWTHVQPAELRTRLKPITDTMIMLHEQGVFNRELAFGNAAVGGEEGSRYIFDLESSVSARAILETLGPDAPIPLELMIAMRQEFTPPRVSLKQFVYPNLPEDMRPKTPEELFQMEYELLYEPYEMALAKSNSPYKANLMRAYRNMIGDMRKELQESRDGRADLT
jgi:hypothetical protein